MSSYRASSPPYHPCRVVSLGFTEGRKTPKVIELDYDSLRSMLEQDDCDKSAECGFEQGIALEDEAWHESRRLQGRLLMVEDIDQRTMELLGTHSNIDPMFFAGQLHVPWRGIQTQVPEQCVLPSQVKRQSFTNIYHHRTLSFDNVVPPTGKLLRRMNIERKVASTPIAKDQYVGIVQHCTSVLLSRQQTRWLGIILVDRRIDGKYLHFAHDKGDLESVTLTSRMFLCGYEDFLDSPPMEQHDEEHARSPERRGLLEDLLFYWSTDPPESFDSTCPSLHSLAYYPLKIVAAEWVKYLGIMYRAIKQYEYSTSITNVREELDKLNSDMHALQVWRRRSMATEHKIKAVIRMLNTSSPGDTISKDSTSLIEDFEYILMMVESFGRRLESVLPVVTSLVQIIDSRRSIDETANVSRLTIMALVFVPLTYVSSLFSMTESLGPGGPFFWVYFAVAIPVTIAVLVIAKSPLSKPPMALRRTWRIGRSSEDVAARRGKARKTEV